MAEALVGEGRRPWWVPGVQMTSSNIYIYVYRYDQTKEKGNIYIGEVAS